MLGVMTIYALCDTRWLMIPVLLLNGAMIVSTLPVGGHHLIDVFAGAGLTFGAILLVRTHAKRDRTVLQRDQAMSACRFPAAGR